MLAVEGCVAVGSHSQAAAKGQAEASPCWPLWAVWLLAATARLQPRVRQRRHSRSIVLTSGPGLMTLGSFYWQQLCLCQWWPLAIQAMGSGRHCRRVRLCISSAMSLWSQTALLLLLALSPLSQACVTAGQPKPPSTQLCRASNRSRWHCTSLITLQRM